MACIRALTSLNLGLLGPLTAELAALERLKKSPYAYNGKNHVSIFFSAVLDWILFILAGNDNIHESLDEFEIPTDPATGFHGNRWCYDGKTVSPLFLDCFSSISFHTCR